MPTIYVDNMPYQVPEGRNLLAACLSLGFNLPYFCWHPAMHSVGACRQCAVKQFKNADDKVGRIVMACMTPAAEGTRISIDDPEARAFRRGVVEFLMVNHPHDCPVCDEGGECHLQDMTVMTGHAYRRFRFKKRTFRNQDLGPLVNHELNRCIACYRCVRFYNDYAGGRDFGVFAWHNLVYFGRHADGCLESEFSGNLVEVCPTGVFTDKTLMRHYTRKWDLQTAPSVCVHCGVGCNTIPGERYGTLRRVRNRYNGQVNGYFLCDRGRYGYEFVNHERRIRTCMVAGQAVAKEEALRRTAAMLEKPGRAVGIGSPRASLEANFALRALVGPERFCLGMSEAQGRLVSAMLEIMQTGPARTPSLHDCSGADAVLVLGEDVTMTAPMMALALRQALLQKARALARELQISEWDDAAVRRVMQKDYSPLFVATPDATKLDEVSAAAWRGTPDDIARLGLAVAHAIAPESPGVSDLSDDLRAPAEKIAQALRAAARPLIVSGPGCGSEAVIRAAANVARALAAAGKPAQLAFAMPECNSAGLGLMGGGTLADAARALKDGDADTVVILENDLYRRADADAVDALLAAARHVVVIDHLATATTAKAEVVLPAATFAESDGTFVSSEGRAQRFFKVMVPTGDVQDSWRWLRDISVAAGRLGAGAWPTFDRVLAAMTEALPVFRPVADIAPAADFRMAGAKVPRQPHRYSGRTAETANVSVHEPKSPDDPDSPLAFTMEGFEGLPPSPLIREYWAPGWNSVQALNKKLSQNCGTPALGRADEPKSTAEGGCATNKGRSEIVSKFQSEVNGPLIGGDPGRRLVEPPAAAKGAYFAGVPRAFRAEEKRRLVVPLHHIYGSEELSILAPGLAQLAPRAYVALRPEDAERFGLADGAEVHVVLERSALRLPVRLRASLPAGTAGLPVGLPGLPYLALPAWAEITPADLGVAGGPA